MHGRDKKKLKKPHVHESRRIHGFFTEEVVIPSERGSSEDDCLRNKNSMIRNLAPPGDFPDLLEMEEPEDADDLDIIPVDIKRRLSISDRDDTSCDSVFSSSAESLQNPFEEEDGYTWLELVKSLKAKPVEVHVTGLELETLSVHLGIEMERLNKTVRGKGSEKYKLSAAERIEKIKAFLEQLKLTYPTLTHGELRDKLAALKKDMYPNKKEADWAHLFHYRRRGFTEITRRERSVDRDETGFRSPRGISSVHGK